jgi:hypothetical protein
MTREQMIAGAADILKENLPYVSQADLVMIATKLYDFYFKPGGPQRHIPAGEVAQKFRERFECLCTIRGELCAFHQLGTPEFVECDECAAKPGTPPLCPACLKRRAMFKRPISRETFDGLNKRST